MAASPPGGYRFSNQMRNSLVSAFAVLLGIVGAVAEAPLNQLTPEETAVGWKLLFDGRTTAGWRALGGKTFPPTGWTVADGALWHARGGGDIVTVEKFEDFEFAWEWNIAERGNSGVKYFLPDPDGNIGFEFQLLDDLRHPDGMRGGRLHQTGGLYDLIEPSPDSKANPPGQWNHSRLIIRGNNVEHWLNGGRIVTFVLGSADLKARIAKSKYRNIPGFGEKKPSPILLQDHGDAVSFRNMKIRTFAR